MQPANANGVAPNKAKAGEKATAAAILDTVLTSLDDSKAEDVVSIDISDKSSVADFIVVSSGRSHRHVGAVSDRLMRDLKDAGFGTPKVEGLPSCDWVLMDIGDVVVHIFRPEVRDFYNLEKMWQADSAKHLQEA